MIRKYLSWTWFTEIVQINELPSLCSLSQNVFQHWQSHINLEKYLSKFNHPIGFEIFMNSMLSYVKWRLCFIIDKQFVERKEGCSWQSDKTMIKMIAFRSTAWLLMWTCSPKDAKQKKNFFITHDFSNGCFYFRRKKRCGNLLN